MSETSTRKLIRVQKPDVITITIPAMTIVIDTEKRDGKLFIGVTAPLSVVIGDAVETVEGKT